MMVSKKRLEDEIKNTEETIEKMEEIIEQSKDGIMINKLVVEAFKDELAKK